MNTRRQSNYHHGLWLALALVIIILPGLVSSQQPSYRVEQVSIEQGVPHNHIQCMLQDRKGFMWFGTLLGLVRFDGYTYKTYRHDPRDPFSLSNDDIKALYEKACCGSEPRAA